jgi:hypothetical protein
MRLLAFVFSLGLLPSAARGEPVARVIAVVGAPGEALRAGDPLEAGASLVVRSGTTVQLALGPASLAIVGPARGRVGQRGLELFEAEAARLAGRGLLVVPGGYRVEGATGSVVFERGQLHLRSGEARVSPPALGPTIALRAPRSVRLGLQGELLPARAALPAEIEERLDRFGPPPRWRLSLGPVSAAEVSRAVEIVRAERERERQAASCGCTESRSGSVGQLPGSGSSLSPIERSASTLRVRITGVPRSAP